MTATLSLALLERAYGRAFNKAQKTNALSVLDALTEYGDRFGMLQPHRTVQYLAQLMHESGGFIYDREVWGPTKAQKGYEGRRDLGNTQKGDGSKFRGYGPGQVTGRANHRAYTKWAKTIDPAAPNFEATPEKVNTDPWEGLSAIWYWDNGNPDGKSLNRLADRGDIENTTRKWNGGLNGYADRLKYYDRLALAFLGHGVNDMPKFQKLAKLEDTSGTSGPLTRAALHSALLKLTAPQHLSDRVATAPVVEAVAVEVPVAVEVEKPVVPVAVEKAVQKNSNWLTGWLSSFFVGGGGAAWVAGMNWQGLALIGGMGLVVLLLVLFFGEWGVRRVQAIKKVAEA
jgi:putative chitinase